MRSHLPDSRPLSFFIALLCAAIITYTLFTLMYRLIHRDENRNAMLDNLPIVELYEQKKLEQEPEAEKEIEPEEPELPELAPVMSSILTPTVNLELPPMVLQAGLLDIAVSGNWAPPLGNEVATGDSDAAGEKNTGFRTIIPISTRQPNVPKIAWENKIDGWVLVSFVVSKKGRVSKIRVMDAYPKGVFEEYVIASVENWLYSSMKNPIQLTQKIELFWKDYPNNIRQLK